MPARGRQRRRHADRFRRSARHRIHPDACGNRARQGARRQCRADHPQRRGSGRAGDRRRPGRCRHRRALHADPEGRRADPALRADLDAALLPGGQRRILQDLEGSRRTGGGGSGARLRHRGRHAADGQERTASRSATISYVPGSEVRRNALLQGTLKASIVDAANRRALEAEAPGKFIVLPVENLSATDEGVVRHGRLSQEQRGRCRHPGRGTDEDRPRDHRKPRRRRGIPQQVQAAARSRRGSRRGNRRILQGDRRGRQPGAERRRRGCGGRRLRLLQPRRPDRRRSRRPSRSRTSGMSPRIDRAVAKLGKK